MPLRRNAWLCIFHREYAVSAVTELLLYLYCSNGHAVWYTCFSLYILMVYMGCKTGTGETSSKNIQRFFDRKIMILNGHFEIGASVGPLGCLERCRYLAGDSSMHGGRTPIIPLAGRGSLCCFAAKKRNEIDFRRASTRH